MTKYVSVHVISRDWLSERLISLHRINKLRSLRFTCLRAYIVRAPRFNVVRNTIAFNKLSRSNNQCARVCVCVLRMVCVSVCVYKSVICFGGESCLNRIYRKVYYWCHRSRASFDTYSLVFNLFGSWFCLVLYFSSENETPTETWNLLYILFYATNNNMAHCFG